VILNRQHRVRVSVTELNRFLATVQKRLAIPGGAVAVALVTDSEIKRLNRLFRGKNRRTDVLSFPSDAWPDQSKVSRKRQPASRGTRRSAGSYLGDIAIAPAVARTNSRRFGRTFAIEMRILVLHGILHLMGYDHETDHGQMERREAGLRRELGLG
jgi:probable rRNA maturation factor